MGYISEPKNIDLVVAPSVFKEETKNRIGQAIAHYKKSRKKPVSIPAISQEAKAVHLHVNPDL